MSWTARGELWGRQMTLTWDGTTGAARWPGAVRRMIEEPAFSGTHVKLTVTGPSLPLKLSDPVALATWLHQQGMKLSGDLPFKPLTVPAGAEA